MRTKFSPGFRISIIDCIIISASFVTAALVSYYLPPFHWIIVFVVGHFFLFCNVFRFDRLPELIWATTFLLQMAGFLTFGIPSFLYVLLIQLVISFALIILEIRKPGYHGFAWQKLNPNLPKWFNEQS